MAVVLIGNWWALAIRGILAIVFGILALVWPGGTLTALVLLFGAYAIIDGVLAIVGAVVGSGEETKWWALLLQGVLGVAAGAVTFVRPGITALFLLYVIAFWAILKGALEISTAIRLRKEISGEWFMALSGIVSVLFGVLIVLFPGAGALAVVWWIGAWAIVFGALTLALGFRLRSLRQVPRGEPRVA